MKNLLKISFSKNKTKNNLMLIYWVQLAPFRLHKKKFRKLKNNNNNLNSNNSDFSNQKVYNILLKNI